MLVSREKRSARGVIGGGRLRQRNAGLSGICGEDGVSVITLGQMSGSGEVGGRCLAFCPLESEGRDRKDRLCPTATARKSFALRGPCVTKALQGRRAGVGSPARPPHWDRSRRRNTRSISRDARGRDQRWLRGTLHTPAGHRYLPLDSAAGGFDKARIDLVGCGRADALNLGGILPAVGRGRGGR